MVLTWVLTLVISVNRSWMWVRIMKRTLHQHSGPCWVIHVYQSCQEARHSVRWWVIHCNLLWSNLPAVTFKHRVSTQRWVTVGHREATSSQVIGQLMPLHLCTSEWFWMGQRRATGGCGYLSVADATCTSPNFQIAFKLDRQETDMSCWQQLSIKRRQGDWSVVHAFFSMDVNEPCVF